MFLLRALLCLVSLPVWALAATAPGIAAPTAVPGTDGTVAFAAAVTPGGALTSVVFEYGTTTAYGKTTAPVFVSADAPATPVAASATGLAGGREHHFRVVATNNAGEKAELGSPFSVPAYAPVLTIQAATGVVNDDATVRATITRNGRTGTAVFQFTKDATFDMAAETPPLPIDVAKDTETLTANLPGLDRGVTYRFRLLFRPDGLDPVPSGELTFFTNQPPRARADTFHLRALRNTELDVLKNDTDADTDDVPALLLLSTTGATKGTATRTADGKRIAYVPGAAFRGSDTFTYTITDALPTGTASASVTIRAFGLLLAGNHGGLLVDANGEAVGYFKITTTGAGAFSGSVLVNGVKESFTGAFGSDGKFRGSLEIDGRTVPVTLAATVSGEATTVAVDFDDGRFTAALRTTEASAAVRADAAGRYTVEFPSGTSTSDPGNSGADPAGSGWAALKLGPDGVARLKGRLADGRSFSSRGVLGVASTGPVVTFFDDPRRTRVAGTLALDDAVAGTLAVVRDSGGSGLFADGYTLQSTASGARYVEPADGKRAIEGNADVSGRRLTFATSGGDAAENFTRELRVDEDDSVTVLDRDSEALKVKIDRDSGRFTAWFTGSTNDRRIKGTGVFIQGTSGSALGRGAGVFQGEIGTGRITLTAAGSTPPPTDTTTGTTR